MLNLGWRQKRSDKEQKGVQGIQIQLSIRVSSEIYQLYGFTLTELHLQAVFVL